MPLFPLLLLPPPFSWFRSAHPSGWDVLVNNAGFAFKGSAFGATEARTTIGTNYEGTRRLTEALLPLARASSSEWGGKGEAGAGRDGSFVGTTFGG